MVHNTVLGNDSVMEVVVDNFDENAVDTKRGSNTWLLIQVKCINRVDTFILPCDHEDDCIQDAVLSRFSKSFGFMINGTIYPWNRITEIVSKCVESESVPNEAIIIS